MQGIKQFPRKEKSAYKPSDIWTDEDHALFLKYCPEKRDKVAIMQWQMILLQDHMSF